jgi:hypothetical protein
MRIVNKMMVECKNDHAIDYVNINRIRIVSHFHQTFPQPCGHRIILLGY